MELKLSKLKVKSLQAKIRRIEKNEEQLMAILGEKEKRAPMITSGEDFVLNIYYHECKLFCKYANH